MRSEVEARKEEAGRKAAAFTLLQQELERTRKQALKSEMTLRHDMAHSQRQEELASARLAEHTERACLAEQAVKELQEALRAQGSQHSAALQAQHRDNQIVKDEIAALRSANEQLERAVTQLTQERVQHREQQASWYAERERLEAFGVQEERKHADTCAALAGARKELDVRQRGFDEQRAELSAAVAVAEDSRKKLDLSFAQAEMLSGEIQVSLCKREALVAGLC
jgi:hypothetical protein